MRIDSSLHGALARRLACLALGLTVATAFVAQAGDARAQEEIEIEVAPPAPRVEVIPAPVANHFWIHGYFVWVRGAHVWVPGRYDVIRPGWSWSEARWAPVGRRWHFYPGHWYR